MAKESIITLRANYILEIGFKIKNMVRAFIFMKMVKYIQVHLKTT